MRVSKTTDFSRHGIRLVACLQCCAIAAQCGCDKQVGVSVDATALAAATTNSRVEFAVVKQKDLVDAIELPIEIEGYEATDLVSKLEGYVGKVAADIGDEVEQGDLLVALDVPEMLAEEERLAKIVDRERAELSSVEARIAQAQAKVGEQQALLKLRQTELDRIQGLVGRGSLNESKQDEAQFAVDAGRAAMRRIEADVEAAKAEVAGAKAEVKVAEAELAKARAMARYLEITAPFDGLVTKRMVDPGAFVRPTSGGGEPLMRVERVDRLRIVLFARSVEASKLDQGDSVVLAQIHGNRQVDLPPMKITRIAKSFDKETRMMRAEVDFNNVADADGNRQLKPGDYGKAIVTLDRAPGVFVVPPAAIANASNSPFIVAVDDSGKCRRVTVQVVKTEAGQTFIKAIDELAAGSRIVAAAPGDFESGQQLEIESPTTTNQ